MSYYKISLSNTPNAGYSFRLSMKKNAVNVDIRIKLRYSDIYDVWLMDVYRGQNDLLVSGIPLICGINLLEAHSYLELGEAYILSIRNSDLAHPDNKSLGTDFIMVWGDDT